MSRLTALLVNAGHTVHVGTTFVTSSSTLNVAQRIINALNNGAAEVTVFTSDAPSEVVEHATDLAQQYNDDNDNDDTIVVVQSHETVQKGERKGQHCNASDVYGRIERKAKKDGLTLTYTSPLLHDDNDATSLYGFTVTK